MSARSRRQLMLISETSEAQGGGARRGDDEETAEPPERRVPGHRLPHRPLPASFPREVRRLQGGHQPLLRIQEVNSPCVRSFVITKYRADHGFFALRSFRAVAQRSLENRVRRFLLSPIKTFLFL